MKKTILLVLALTMLLSVAAMAGKVTAIPVVHIAEVFQACPGVATADDCDRSFVGYRTPDGMDGNVITSVPGILQIVPGGSDWRNFVAAAQVPGVDFTIKNVTLTKQTPEHIQCGFDENGREIFPVRTITQQGTQHIRTWWPLLYELPSTVFTLNILYGTPRLFDDDGPGPNPPAWVHLERWEWHVTTDLQHLLLLLELFHELPFGKDEVPLISDEMLFERLEDIIEDAIDAADRGDNCRVGELLGDFELEVMDHCIGVSPSFPNVTGDGTGIANTVENPACCKLLIDVEFILQTFGFGQPSK